ncbi:polysaccharide pyruvyl transferase family protein [Arabiibacter massiliensis]|uniref:polysaccharide pyruvyl transferase family protein n=1 Tax=Arabiibacter massiliensis TaxID=1870985 RepID=UPI00155A2421|nr:polysaccharide pyruvyl transferase family protein [Arabiibacter massiliensis]
MNIAILTIQDYNFGNRLQNYALQEAVRRMGHEVLSLRRSAVKMRALRKAVRRVIKDDYINAFDAFDVNITFSRDVVSKEFVSPSLNEDFGCFVIGSDQVWNPTFPTNSDLDYLPMVPAVKKVAYAPSFGVSKITSNRDHISDLLSGISHVSMREHAGAAIVNDLTGRNVPVVLDPTMLISVSDWAEVSKKPLSIDVGRPFVFKYVLGDDVNGPKIDAMTAELGLSLIDVMDKSLKLGPAEFAWLAANCEVVCTDSFHASVFALLNHRPLAIFERSDSEVDMSSRFDTLCTDFGLVGHRSSDPGFSLDSVMMHDWVDFESHLAARRRDSLNWLEGALDQVCSNAVLSK